mmetsp:Transcript_18442/g.16308  ORF Transcript_18442/g.16308 Transcript_18442/m.16308 type:complete len:185 (+) Transcript_18442:458-1012(+)
MSHCSTCKKCTYRLDHHCPWVNSCISMQNNRFFLSFLVWCFIIFPQNYLMLWHYNETETYKNSPLFHSFAYWFSSAVAYSVTCYCGMEFYLNFSGRTFLELMGQLSRGAAPPKFDLKATWRDYHYLNFGTYNIFPSILFPYLYSTPISGQEYCFLERETKNEDFLKRHSESLRTFLHKFNIKTD